MRKNCIICLFIVAIIAILFIGLNIKDKGIIKDLEVKNSNYINKNKELESKIRDLKNSIVEEREKLLNYDCEYTETYRYIGNYDFIGSIPSIKFIIVDKFQEFLPKILKFDTEEIKINFEKNKNYEFTFKYVIKNGFFTGSSLIKVVETSKIGSDQVQESCKFEI